jgi:hypothetical protein
MNKNLDELAKQAGIEKYLNDEVVIEKFADLILKTCLDIVYYQGQMKNSTPEKVQHSAEIIKTIRQHFEV